MKKRTYFLIITLIMAANAALVSYVHGYRLADFSEVANSQRPQGIFTSVEVDMIGANYADAN